MDLAKSDASRMQKVAKEAGDWANRLIDLSKRNKLLYFTNTRTTVLELPTEDRSTAVFTGRRVQLSKLFTEPDVHAEACRRARYLRSKIVLFEEERGLEVGHVATGVINVVARSWSPNRHTGPDPLRAPLLLWPMKVYQGGAAERDFSLEVTPEPELNPVLLYGLEQLFGVRDGSRLQSGLMSTLDRYEDPFDKTAAVFGHLSEELERNNLRSTLEEVVVAAVFNYAALPMVRDLRESTEILADHDVVAAIAGVPDAAGALAGSGPDEVSPAKPPDVEDEYLVLDADSSQQQAIRAVLSGSHVVIDGPPGTGKSQTIANLIAELVARGKKVLFVAEKRAALEAVTNRLANPDVDLAHLVLDLHDARINKRRFASQLAEGLQRAARSPQPDVAGLHNDLRQLRGRLGEYTEELHRPRGGHSISAYEAMARLADLPALSKENRAALRLATPAVRRLTAQERATAEDAVRTFVTLGGWRFRLGQSPWSHVRSVDEEQAERVLRELDELSTNALRQAQGELDEVLRQTGLARPETFAEWQDVLGLLDEVAESVRLFGPELFGPELERLVHATSSRVERRGRERAGAQPMNFRTRRRTRKRARELRRDGVRRTPVLNRDLRLAFEQQNRWRQRTADGGFPVTFDDLHRVMRGYLEIRERLAAMAAFARKADMVSRRTEDIQQTLDEMEQEREELIRLPELTRAHNLLRELGLEAWLDDLASRGASADEAERELRRAWYVAFLEEVRLHVPVLGSLDGREHERLVEEFGRVDREHHRLNAARVRHLAAYNLRLTRDNYQAQSTVVQREAAKKRGHLPIRELVRSAPDVLLAVRPCWAMSPLVVSTVLPAARLFDVVIFDEASQVQPHAAMTSVMRATQVVVAGDEKQLPPTDVFQRELEDDSETDLDTGGWGEDGQAEVRGVGPDPETLNSTADRLGRIESLLGLMRARLPRYYRLSWHYRSQDERLIEFSNRNPELYDGDLVTFPGTSSVSPLTFHHVDAVARPGRRGSAQEEVAAVVELALRHAEQHPEQSLGIIAFGQNHAGRIERALVQAFALRPELEHFFAAEDVQRRVFVKNIERVQGDERDVIILTLGYAKNAVGGGARLQFGSLGREGGHRRLNVAVTRARAHLHVVSCLTAADLARTEDSRHLGPKLLRDFLDFAQRMDTSGDDEALRFDLPAEASRAANSLVRDIARRIEAAGVRVACEVGTQENAVDVVLFHPERPDVRVLAVETDGPGYRAIPTVRDRERLRHEHLQRLGWSTYRVWSTQWYRDPQTETERILERWKHACTLVDSGHEAGSAAGDGRAAAGLGKDPVATEMTATMPKSGPVRPFDAHAVRGAPPPVLPGQAITQYSPAELDQVFGWLLGDRLELTREERLEQAREFLGFQRRGSRIQAELGKSFDRVSRRQEGR